nr:immunoglobulin light chain junction region [Macaca mulatta]MOX10453.1 immunoglobulin light chain junction region [Macaca mulatta]
CQQGYSYPPTF